MSVWGFLGSIGSSLLGNAFNTHNSNSAAALQYQYQSKLQKQSGSQSYKYTRLLNQNAYQDTVSSMYNAGINPMLAITNGATSLSANVGTGSSSVTAPHTDVDIMSGIATAQQLKNEKQRVKNETDIADSTIRRNNYESDLAHEQAANLNQQTRLLDSYGDAIKQQELINSAKQGALYDKQMQDLDNQMFNRNLSTYSNSRYLNANTNSALQTAIQQKRDNEWFKKHPYWYSFGQGASAVGNIFRGGLSKSFK